jgi:hypothetical protein
MASLYTLAQLQQLALDRLEGNSLFFTLPEITPVINEAIRTVNLICGFYQQTVSIPGNAIANQQLYATPAPLIWPLRIEFEGVQLDPDNLERIGQDFYTWATDTTGSRGPVARWVPIGISMFALHPIPVTGGGRIDVTGVAETPLLVNSTDTMPLEDEFVSIITEYVAHRMPLKEGGRPFAAASELYKNFIRNMKQRTMFQKMQFPRYFVMRGVAVVEDQT